MKFDGITNSIQSPNPADGTPFSKNRIAIAAIAALQPQPKVYTMTTDTDPSSAPASDSNADSAKADASANQALPTTDYKMTTDTDPSSAPASDSNTYSAMPGEIADQALPTARKFGNFTIEKGVPMPAFLLRAGSRGKYPFAERAISESVVIRDVDEKTLYSALHSWRTRKNIDMRMVRADGGSRDFRVFRIA